MRRRLRHAGGLDRRARCCKRASASTLCAWQSIVIGLGERYLGSVWMHRVTPAMINPFIIKATANVASFDNMWVFISILGFSSRSLGDEADKPRSVHRGRRDPRTPSYRHRSALRRFWRNPALLSGRAASNRTDGETCVKMRVVAKAAGVGDRADRLAYAQQLPAIQKARGLVQTQRVDEFGAGKAALRKELLEVA
jgi:hypothetical protein